MLDLWLLAKTDLGRAFARYSQRSNSLEENWIVLLVIGGIAALWIGLYVWDWLRKAEEPAPDVATSLFVELCRAHRLERGERELLARLAGQRDLAQPAMLFVQPAILAEAAAGAMPEAPLLAGLAKRLFGEHGIQSP